MRDVTIEIESLTPYSSSRYLEQSLEKGETLDAHERRRWREKLHTDENGNVFVPGVAFKLALDEAAKLRNEKIKGKGNQTYTRIFTTGVSAISDLPLGINQGRVKSVTIPAHADGQRGSGPRVPRIFPIIPTWGGKIEMRVFNDSLPEEIFERFFAEAGIFSGVGRGRPSMGCPMGLGRFKPVQFTWTEH